MAAARVEFLEVGLDRLVNGFRIEGRVDHAQERHDVRVRQETRLFDASRGVTRPMPLTTTRLKPGFILSELPRPAASG